MTIIEISGQIGILLLLGLGVVITLLFILIARVSALGKMINAIDKKLIAAAPVAEAKKVVSIPKSAAPPLGAGPVTVPDAVIAAISAAVNQYCIENT